MSAATKLYEGLPERLPKGEIVLWQGRPLWRSLALRTFHVRKVGIYFGLLLAWRAALGGYERISLGSVAAGAFPLLLLALSSIGLLVLLAWIYSRTTTYTITNRRVFMRFGAALPLMLNIPFRTVGSAGAKVYRDGTADIPLGLIGSDRIAYLHLWPYARPWRLKNPEPMLRSLPNGQEVAKLLASALSASHPPPLMRGATVPIAGTGDTTHVPAPAAA